jgi:hypothetical protein
MCQSLSNHHLCKLAICPTADGRHFGRCVESSVAPIWATAYPNVPHEVMRSSWTWRRFQRDLTAGKLDAACEQVAGLTGEGVMLWMSAGVQGDPSDGLRHTNDPTWTWLDFAWEQGALRATRCIPGDGPTATLADCASLAELGRRIETVPGIGWRWIDLYIGVACDLAPARVDPGPDAWHSQKLWERCLAPRLPWVR